MLPERFFIYIAFALLAFFITDVKTEHIEIEAEDGLYTGSKRDRSAASGRATVHLTSSQSVTNDFVTQS